MNLLLIKNIVFSVRWRILSKWRIDIRQARALTTLKAKQQWKIILSYKNVTFDQTEADKQFWNSPSQQKKKGMDHTKRMHVKNYETIFDSFYPCLDGILWPIGNLVAFKFYAKCERADAK